jgi:ABC-type multidrug transport system fused ATPase/permease subunit
LKDVFQLEAIKKKYANRWYRSIQLISQRFLTLWVRDKKVLMFSIVRNVINGASVGGAFLNADDFISIQGALFQTGVFILLGSLQSSSGLVADRVLYHKQANANFYSAWPYVLGRAISQLPQVRGECVSLYLLSSYLTNLLFAFSRPMKPKTLLLDTLVSGAILYYMIGLADRDSFPNFVIYSVVLFVFATLMNQQMALFASFGTNSQVQVYGACTLFFAILFSGFIIPLQTIPDYLSWIYWWNPFAWAYNALILNEVYSGRWSNPDAILIANGFVKPDGSVLDEAYIGWGVLYMSIYWIVCCIFTALGLTYATDSNGAGAAPEKIVDSGDVQETNQDQSKIVIPFKPLALSFQNLCYEVTASTSKEKLMLLKNINGIFHPGRMCALMGSSGAG